MTGKVAGSRIVYARATIDAPRDDLGIMARTGDAVYLPLRRGPNEIVFAVIEYTGGWAFAARLDRDGRRAEC
jgi:hypothetical protein